MEIHRENGTLSVSGVAELNSENARAFRSAIGAELSPGLQTIEIDLSQTQIVDGTGLGALVSLYKTANAHQTEGNVAIRLINLPPPVLQMIELARLHHLFEIASTSAKPAGDSSDDSR